MKNNTGKKKKGTKNNTCTVLWRISKLLASRIDWAQLQLLQKQKNIVIYSYYSCTKFSSSSQCCVFKIVLLNLVLNLVVLVCGILGFEDWETRNCQTRAASAPRAVCMEKIYEIPRASASSLHMYKSTYSSNPSDCPIHVSGYTRHANEDYRTSIETS
jgi:hypothetical protein